MLVLDVKRTKEDFLKKKGKSSVRTFKSYTQIFKGIEKFDDNTSEAIRHLCRLGIDLEKIKPHELDQSKIEEITKDMNQKIKDESFFEFINSKTPDQQIAIKNWITIQQEERIKKDIFTKNIHNF